MEDQLSVTFTTTHCNETTETWCEINNIINLTNGKSLAPEVNPTMQNISPLPTMRITTDAKTTPKVPTASSYPMLKNTKKNPFPVDWLGKLPLIEGKHKLQSVKFLNNKLVNGQKKNLESTSYTYQKQYVAPDEIDDHFLGLNWKKTESANAQSLSQTGLAQPLEAGSTYDKVIKMPIQVRITLRKPSRRTVYHQRSYNRQLVPVMRLGIQG